MKILYVKINSERTEAFQLKTIIYEENGKKFVKKEALCKQAIPHLKKIKDHYTLLSNTIINSNIQLAKIISEDENSLVFEYINGISFEKKYFDALKTAPESAKKIINEYISLISGGFKTISFDDKLLVDWSDLFGNIDCSNFTNQSFFSNVSNIDLNLSNIITKNGIHYIIDYEWVFELSVPVEFTLYRALNGTAFKSQGQLDIEKYTYNPIYTEMEEYFILNYVTKNSFYQYSMQYSKGKSTIDEKDYQIAQQEQEIQRLEALAQSMRLVNRLKRIFFKIIPVDLFAVLKNFRRIKNLFFIKDIKKSGYFIGEDYLKSYPDVSLSGISPLLHYVLFGISEGRIASNVFDDVYYNSMYPSVAKSGMNPFLHYSLYGQYDGYVARKKVSGSKSEFSLSHDLIGVRFYGPVNRVSGLGVSCRGYLDSLAYLNKRLDSVNVVKGFEHQKEIKNYAIPKSNLIDNDIISIMHLNPDCLCMHIKAHNDELKKSKYKIAIWYWELPVFPPHWWHMINYFDEIWVASKFPQRAIQASTHVPVKVIPPFVHVPEINSQNKNNLIKKYSLESFKTIFLYMFDASSYLERKNPQCVIEAFINELSNCRDALLILKMSYSWAGKEYAENIINYCKKFDNILIINDVMDSDDVYALLATSTCYVSPHRSEGFGLTIIEAMILKKIVIATDYSATMDFVNENTAIPVKTKKIEISETMGPYQKGFIWGDPDVIDFGKKMKMVYEGSIDIDKKINNAYNLVMENYSEKSVTTQISKRIDEIIHLKSMSN